MAEDQEHLQCGSEKVDDFETDPNDVNQITVATNPRREDSLKKLEIAPSVYMPLSLQQYPLVPRPEMPPMMVPTNQLFISQHSMMEPTSQQQIDAVTTMQGGILLPDPLQSTHKVNQPRLNPIPVRTEMPLTKYIELTAPVASRTAGIEVATNKVNSEMIQLVFRNQQLRKGKWHPAEEIYADLLIELFKKGRLNEPEYGCALIPFLSSKLHCSPMRISKKYTGKGIGKIFFIPNSAPDMTMSSRHDCSGGHQISLADNDIKNLQKAEDEFHKAVLLEEKIPPVSSYHFVGSIENCKNSHGPSFFFIFC
jgi:hypothetical protein